MPSVDLMPLLPMILTPSSANTPSLIRKVSLRLPVPQMLERLRQAALANDNVFEVLMDAVRCCSLGQITRALFEVGGQYRRNM
jgi:methylmalonyl-CoA mutase N-terminal domain/subunit